eukprot:IDg22941t1
MDPISGAEIVRKSKISSFLQNSKHLSYVSVSSDPDHYVFNAKVLDRFVCNAEHMQKLHKKLGDTICVNEVTRDEDEVLSNGGEELQDLIRGSISMRQCTTCKKVFRREDTFAVHADQCIKPRVADTVIREGIEKWLLK